MKILITGSAGFIGYHLVKSLLKNKSNKILSIDNFDNYYDKKLKLVRIKDLKLNDNIKRRRHKFVNLDLKNKKKLNLIIKNFKPQIIVHLAAQAGVRLSLSNPYKYLNDNIKVFLNILEISKNLNLKKIIYASSSSVYGSIKKYPYTEKMIVNQPKQFYAVTKLTNELMAKAYCDLYNMQMIGIRFFTIYGPYGRPDMAIYKFTKNIINRKKIEVFNNGDHYRDFTYIDDAVNGIEKIIRYLVKKKSKYFNIFNIGNSKPIKILDLIKKIEKLLNLKAKIKYLPLQKGEVHKTFADTTKSKKFLNYKSSTKIDKGLTNFINWFKNYHKF